MVSFGQTPSGKCIFSHRNIAEANMTPFEQAHWIATANIKRFEELLKTEGDICQRQLLQSLIVLEQEKFKTIYRPDRRLLSRAFF